MKTKKKKRESYIRHSFTRNAQNDRGLLSFKLIKGRQSVSSCVSVLLIEETRSFLQLQFLHPLLKSFKNVQYLSFWRQTCQGRWGPCFKLSHEEKNQTRGSITDWTRNQKSLQGDEINYRLIRQPPYYGWVEGRELIMNWIQLCFSCLTIDWVSPAHNLMIFKTNVPIMMLFVQKAVRRCSSCLKESFSMIWWDALNRKHFNWLGCLYDCTSNYLSCKTPWYEIFC